MSQKDQFIPHLIVSDGLGALEFYKETFGAEIGDNMMSPDGGKLMHGEIVLDGQKLFVSDWFAPSDGGSLSSPEKLGGTCVRITINVDDADAVFERAMKRGSQALMPVQDMFWGPLWQAHRSIRPRMGHQSAAKRADTRGNASKFG